MGNRPTTTAGDVEQWARSAVAFVPDAASAYPMIAIGKPAKKDGRTIRILVLSDTHGQHRQLPLPAEGADVLLHCGDWSNWKTSRKDTEDFNRWLGTLEGYTRRIVVAGNHELCLCKQTTQKIRETMITNAEYYSGGDLVTHDSLKMWLSPLTRSRNVTYRANAFSKSSEMS